MLLNSINNKIIYNLVMYMLFNIFNKKKKGNDNNNLNAFNLEEIEEFNKLGKEKINQLNNNTITQTKQEIISTTSETKEELESSNKDTPKEEIIEDQSNHTPKEDKNTIDDDIINESIKVIAPPKEDKVKISYINLSDKEQKKITDFLNNIDLSILNEDIEKGIDLSNHNYTISYCDDAYKFINELRTKYSIVLKYLIGFNNEKHGIYNKTTFGNNEIDEWKYLSNYIKLLEKIKTIKK